MARRAPNDLGEAAIIHLGTLRLGIVARRSRYGVFCADADAFDARGGLMLLATVMTSLHRLAA